MNTATLVPIPITINVTQQALADLIVTAIEGGRFGIEYWCPKIRLRHPDFPEGYDLAEDAAPADWPHADILVAERRDDETWNAFIARNVAEGGSLTLYENDEDKDELTPRRLTHDKLVAGVARWIVRGGGKSLEPADDETGAFDLDMDGPAADEVLQYALFGEQVYG